jgi:MFS family permease
MDVWRTPFRNTLLTMLAFHFSQYLAVPLFPLFFVRTLRLTDEALGIGTALFYLAMLVGSTQLNRMVRWLGHKTVTAWGVMGMGLYPVLLAVSNTVWHYYVISLIGGFVWALVGGAYINYLLEKCPENDRPAHLAWYNVILNGCVVLGSLAGPEIAGYISLPVALLIFGALRVAAGISILKWG